MADQAGVSVKKSPVYSPQYRPRVVSYTCNLGVLANGKYDGTVANPSTGVYVITFAQNFARVPEIGGTSKTDNLIVRILAVDQFSVSIELNDVTSGNPAAGSFCLLVVGSDAKDAILHP